MGYARPQEDEVNIGVTYTSCVYERHPDIKDAQPLSEPVPHKIPSNLRQRCERLNRFPMGYLVMGVALCSFNPIYAQGMSVAGMEARVLDAYLTQGKMNLSTRFFKQAGKIIDIPRRTAVGNDLRFPEVEGPRTAMTRFINWYVGKLHHTAHHDAEVSVAFLKVVNLLLPPPSLMHPRASVAGVARQYAPTTEKKRCAGDRRRNQPPVADRLIPKKVRRNHPQIIRCPTSTIPRRAAEVAEDLHPACSQGGEGQGKGNEALDEGVHAQIGGDASGAPRQQHHHGDRNDPIAQYLSSAQALAPLANGHPAVAGDGASVQ